MRMVRQKGTKHLPLHGSPRMKWHNTSSEIGRNYLVESAEKCFFLVRKFMFMDGEHKFKVHEHMFAGGEHKFTAHEHKMNRARK